MPRLSVSSRRRVAASSSPDDDVPGQMLLFAPIAGRVVELRWELHVPASSQVDPWVGRMEGAARRLRRGAVASGPKVRRATVLMEELAGLFDGR